MQFKVGDRVILDNIRDPWGSTFVPSVSNTVGNIGVVTKVYNDYTLNYRVNWDNGSCNGYDEVNLKHMEIVNV